jgi:hypothetical protein
LAAVYLQTSMLDDRQLLSQYASQRFEAAFRELVSAINLVFPRPSAVWMENVHPAEDSEIVFADLARKADRCPKRGAGWVAAPRRALCAAQLLRTERRSRRREQEAIAMNCLKSEPAPDWQQIRPLLDAALDRLVTSIVTPCSSVLRATHSRRVGHALRQPRMAPANG